MLLAATCPVCGRPGAAPCATCAAALRPAPVLHPPPGVDEARALVAYEGAGRELVARLKYRNARSALPWLAAGMAALVGARGVDLVTWVPTSTSRRRDRGFDQAELLARAVAARLGRPCRRCILRGPGPPQTGATAAQRRRAPAMTPARRAPRLVRDRHVLVVDDVCTTGASLAAAAAALRAAGAASVLAVTAAATPPRGGGTGPTLGHGPPAGWRRRVGNGS